MAKKKSVTKKAAKKAVVAITGKQSLIPVERIAQSIYLIRGQKVMLDAELAALYGVDVRILKRAVRRNIERFPDDFMIELTQVEDDSLRSQIGILKRGGHSKYLPFAFTENGVAMLSSVLRSSQAIQVNIEIMRAFTRLRSLLASNQKLVCTVEDMKREMGEYGEAIAVLFHKIEELMEPPPEKSKGRIGFRRH